jgi:PAS domain S-box-containing protein
MPDLTRQGAFLTVVRPRRLVLASAAGLFLAVLVLRLAIDSPSDVVTLLFAVPIAMVAVELGMIWGLAAAGLAVAVFAVWAAGWAADVPGAFYFVSRGGTFLVIGGVVGGVADRLRTVSADGARFWELSSDLMCRASLDGYFTRLNPAWEQKFGWTTEELRSRPFIDFVHPDDRERTLSVTSRLAAVGYRAINFENRHRCKDGSYRALDWSATSIPEEGLIYAIARDSTASKQGEAELRGSEQFLDSVLQNLPNMVFVKDAEELRFVRVNRAGERLLGTASAELMGKSDYDLFPESQAKFFVEKDREVLASGETVDIAEEPIETDKGTRILHTRKMAIADERGRPAYLLGISEDITERHAAERATRVAKADAESANRAKSEFLSRMSHELRTPLNAVIGFGQLLELDDLERQQRDGVEQILKAGRHLLGLINEVLDISRIESGTMSMSLEPVHLASVLADALSLIRPLADEAQVRLEADPARLAEVHVQADQQRLKQVLINLLANAVKYNRPGGEVRVEFSLPAEGRVELAVADSGHGMSHEQVERLFKPFDRLGAERGDVEGTGLGLPLSIGLMEAMGGTIRAESEPEVGTTMRVELHAAPPPPDEEAARIVARAGNGREPHDARVVLYVEDNISNLKLVEQALERVPEVHLIPAMHGQLGIDLARQHGPDLILLDLHLPDLKGDEVLERLKRDPTTSQIPVVIISADATPTQVKRLLAAGAAEYLTKPIDIGRLLDIVTGDVAALAGG